MAEAGDCRLVYKGFHQLELQRCGGSRIRIGGVSRTLQEKPPTVVSRLPVDTVQFIYARWDEKSERVRLEASTTGHVPADGVEIKEGDPSRTLVGMGRPFESRREHYHWAERSDSLLILSWFNRRPVEGRRTLWRDEGTAAAAWEEIPGCRLEFLAWGDAPVAVTASGEWRSAEGGGAAHLAPGLDGEAAEASALRLGGESDGWQPLRASMERRVGEGFHCAALLGRAEAGVAL
ncbi:MAG: hypothetical protein V3V56_05155, partial [bacterium]